MQKWTEFGKQAVDKVGYSTFDIESSDGEFVCSSTTGISSRGKNTVSLSAGFYITVKNCTSREKSLLLQTLNKINSLFNVRSFFCDIVRVPERDKFFTGNPPSFTHDFLRRNNRMHDNWYKLGVTEEYVIIAPVSEIRANSIESAFDEFKKFKADILNLKNKGYLNKIIDLVN